MIWTNVRQKIENEEAKWELEVKKGTKKGENEKRVRWSRIEIVQYTIEVRWQAGEIANVDNGNSGCVWKAGIDSKKRE